MLKLPSPKARRFRRWLSNRRINVISAHHPLIGQALSVWKRERLYLSLDTTVVWNCLCIVWVGVVYRGRTVPVAWRVVAHSSSTVRLWTIQRVLRQTARLMPDDVAIVLLAGRGFADGKLMKYRKENLGWHFRIRIKRSFQFQLEAQWRKVSSVQLQPGQACFTPAVSVGKIHPYPNVYLAFAHDKPSDENWLIVSDEPTSLQTFAQYRLRFCVEESFLALKCNGFNLEASRLRDKFALSQLCGVIALTMLFLVLQGVQVVVSGKRRPCGCSLEAGDELLTWHGKRVRNLLLIRLYDRYTTVVCEGSALSFIAALVSLLHHFSRGKIEVNCCNPYHCNGRA